MRVAHESDHITHAIIGGKEAINFGISDDPAFFQILSSSLYKDPMLAMVRETICNAWDAHIDAGIDTPLEITLTDEYLSIKDFGKGIPDALIGPIYGVYGASTKKNDGRQTGGFGLGCKSPFSYTDHFEVTSCHEGMKTIYNMSKSSAQLQGKPSIVPIASFPTTETGITVKVPLNPERKNSRLCGLVEQVVFNGDIKAVFNERLLQTLGLDTSAHGFVLLRNASLRDVGAGHLGDHFIHLRYGNVIYPLEASSEYLDLYTKVRRVVEGHFNCRLVLLAPPDSVSITPSRDSVTMSDITAATIKDMLVNFLTVFFKNQDLTRRLKTTVNEFVDKEAAKQVPIYHKIQDEAWEIPGVEVRVSDSIMRDMDQFAILEVLLRYSKRSRTTRFRAKQWLYFMKRYLFQLDQSEIDRGTLQRWYRTAQAKVKLLTSPTYSWDRERQRDTDTATVWWQKNVSAPIISKMSIALGEDVSKHKMLYLNPRAIVSGKFGIESCTRVGRVQIQTHTHNLVHLLKPTIVVSHDNTTVQNRMGQIDTPESFKGTGRKGVYFFYELARGEHAEEKLAALKKIPGIEAFDFTKRTAHEERIYQKQKELAAERARKRAASRGVSGIVKKPKVGLVRMDTIFTGSKINTMLFSTNTDPEKLTKPEFIALISTAKDKRHQIQSLGHLREVHKAVIMLYGTLGVVTNKSDAYEKKIGEGVMDVATYVVDKVLHAVQNSPTLLARQATSISRIKRALGFTQYDKNFQLVEMMYQCSELHHLIPSFVTLSDEETYIWALWEQLNTFVPFKQRPEFDRVYALVEATPIDPTLSAWVQELNNNPFLGLIDPESMQATLRQVRDDPVKQAKAVSIIASILS